MNRIFAGLCLLLLGSLVFLAGCGGGGSGGNGAGGGSGGGTSGDVQFTIHWPTSRVIPVASQSITVTLSFGGTVVAQKTVAKPTGQTTTAITFSGLTPGSLTVTATAFPNPDGTGVAQATGSIVVSIVAGQTTKAALDPTSTIVKVDVVPTTLTLGATETKTIVATPKDAQNNLVLVAPGDLQWQSDTPANATVDQQGHVTGVAPGGANILVTELDSGKSATIPVTVTPPAFLTPSSVVLTLGDTQTFTATFVGNPPLTWSIQEGPAGGTITQGGVYTAPNIPGTYHVVATSQLDATKFATATVLVQAGSGQITIQ